jgi:hypothetical protein
MYISAWRKQSPTQVLSRQPFRLPSQIVAHWT